MIIENISVGKDQIGLYDNLDIDIMIAFRNLIYFKLVWDTFFRDGPLKVSRYISSTYVLSQFLSIYIMHVGIQRGSEQFVKPTMLVNNCLVHLFIMVFSVYENRFSFDSNIKRWISDVIFE